MDRRRKVLVNNAEERAFQLLGEALHQYDARLWAKVRIADILDIKNSGLTKDEYAYALKAHFDFAIEPKGQPVAFAVEFDEEYHITDPKARRNDNLKNLICEKLGLPLLRVEIDKLKQVGKYSILGWLVELWFLYNDFLDAQSRGDVSLDEPFDYQSIFTSSIDDKVEYFPYDPFRNYRTFLMNLCRSNKTMACSVLAVETLGGNIEAIAIISLNNNKAILGRAKCKSFLFPPITPGELAEELSMKDVFSNYWKYREGTYKTVTHTEANGLLKKFKSNSQVLSGWQMDHNPHF